MNPHCRTHPATSNREQPALIAAVLLGLSLLIANLRCTKETIIYLEPPKEETYHFITAYVAITQTLLASGDPYTPEYYSWCANGKSVRAFSVTDQSPYWDFLGPVEVPRYRVDRRSQILRIYTRTPFDVDSSLKGIFWWADIHQLGDCIAPGGDLGAISSLPYPLPVDSTLMVLGLLPYGTVTLSAHGQNRTLLAFDSCKFLARRETVWVNALLPPDSVASMHAVLQLDTLVVRNYGALPKKLVVFEELDW